MASNKNSPQKSQGANEPDKRQSIQSDAADVDWMIMSDVSTRIGGSSQLKPSSNQASSPSQESINQDTQNDLEDLEWLRSLGLDEPIERSPSPKDESISNKSVSKATENNDVENIDWLIMTNLQTRIDNPESRAKANLPYPDIAQSKTTLQPFAQEDLPIDIGLSDALELDGLDFLEGSDFSDLDSLDFDTSESLNVDTLQNEIDDTESKIKGLAEMLDDQDDSSFDLSIVGNDNDWDSISGFLEDNINNISEPSRNQPSFDIVNESFEMETQISAIAETEEDYYENNNLIFDKFESTYQEDLLVDDLELSAIKTDEIVENSEFSSEFQNAVQNEFHNNPDIAQDISFDEEFNNPEKFNNALDDEFKVAQSLEFSALSMAEDDIWSSKSSNLEPEITDETIDDAFTSDWGQTAEVAINGDDVFWDSPPNIDSTLTSSTSIDNAFGTFDDWDSSLKAEPKADEIDAEISDEINDDVNPETTPKEQFVADIEIGDDYADWTTSLEAEISIGNEAVWNEETVETENYLIASEKASSEANDLVDLVENSLIENELIEESINENFDLSGNLDDDDWAIANNASSFTESIGDSATTWEDFNESSSEQITDSDYADDLESIIDENFDLASFDEDSLPEASLSNFNIGSTPTTLTSNRVVPISHPEEEFTSGLIPTPPSISSVNHIPSDPFEDALVNELLNHDDKVDLHEEALANDLLNGYASELDVFEDLVSPKETFTAPFANFDLDISDRDFLDDFELDSIDTDNFADFASATISTGLTPPAPPIAPSPPSLPPLTKQEPTSPTINNPPPPPFLPPLPPKRNLTKVSPPKVPTYPDANIGSQPQPQNKMGIRSEEDDFDRFHDKLDQHKNRSPIHSIDEGWSELLDADTVLSSGRSSTGSSYSEPSITKPPSAGVSAGRASQGRDSRNSSGTPKRKETGLPDFNDLGLEIHNDNADWSGLLDSGDLSDNITTISPQNTQLPSRIRTNPTNTSRRELTNTSETKEIPRDRRQPMPHFGDTTRSNMGATPDQVDFNRFTEDNDDTYDEHMKSVALSSTAPSKPKITMPSVSLESLWQNYLKIPAIGLGVVGGAFLLYSLLNRPVFDLGLRWGLFKDARGKDYTNADFKGAKLDNVDFSDAILTGAKMQDASLVGANFQKANLDGVNFTNANLNRARLIQASVVWAEFNKAQMNLVDLEGADLTLSNFANAKMEGTNLLRSKIGAQGTNKATKFSATMLLAWQIVNEPREGRNLAGQDLSGLNLSFTSLKRANLSNTKLNYTDLTGTDLRGANLTGSQVNGANWSGTKLNGINLTGVTFDKNKLPKTDEETICPNGKKGLCSF